TSVQVAGAVAINVVTTKSLAKINDGLTITSGGVVSVKTTAATIADAAGKGQTVGTGSSDGIGVGVAINLADITNPAPVGSATINATGLDVEATMADKNNGRIRAWDDTAKEWKLVERGVSLPLSPDNGDYFQLTEGAAPTAVVDGKDQDVGAAPHELKVKSTAGFRPAGTFTVAGVTGTCTYTGISSTTKFTGLTGCTGKPDDGAVVISTTGTTVSGPNQTIDGSHLTLTVADATNFPTAGAFTGKGLSGTCSYTSKTGSTQLNGVTGCTGTPDNGTTMTFVRAPGVYKWNGTDWILQAGAITHGTDLPWTDGS